jgi:hypothetical protein
MGAVSGVGGALLGNFRRFFEWQIGGVLSLTTNMIFTLDGAGLASLLLSGMIAPAAIALGYFFVFFLLRLVLRSTRGAAVVFVALFCAPIVIGSVVPVVETVFTCLLLVLYVWVMIRFGILPLTLVILFIPVVGQTPLTSDLSAWYADKGLIVVALVLALAAWSFRNALGGRNVLKGDFLDG